MANVTADRIEEVLRERIECAIAYGGVERRRGLAIESDAVLPARDAVGAAKRDRYTLLVTQHATNLPAAQNRTGEAVIEKRLALAERQFVEESCAEHIGHVLAAQRFFLAQIRCVLDLPDATIGGG